MMSSGFRRGLVFAWVCFLTCLLLFIAYSSTHFSSMPEFKTHRIYFGSGQIIKVVLCPLSRDWSVERFDGVDCDLSDVVVVDSGNVSVRAWSCNVSDVLPHCLVYESRQMLSGREKPTYLPLRNYIPVYEGIDYLAYVYYPYNDDRLPKAFLFRAVGNWSEGVIDVEK